MIEKIIATQKHKKNFLIEFNTINEFVDYINNTSYNRVFSNSINRLIQISSNTTSEKGIKFTGTESYEEALDLLLNGWKIKTKELNEKIKIENLNTIKTKKNFISQVGYQPVVPLYLSNNPQNMVNSKMVTKKHKILNVVKCVSYPYFWSAEKITEEAVKALQIVQELEKQNYRVNLYVCFSSYAKSTKQSLNVLVKIKNSHDKLNLSKISFPLVHPSMARRMMFKFVESYPRITVGLAKQHGYVNPVEDLEDVLEKSGKKYFVIPKEVEEDYYKKIIEKN